MPSQRRYERNAQRASTRADHYERGLQTKAGTVQIKASKLRHVPFETAIIEHCRRASSVEEASVEMYLAGVSVRRVEDILEALWGGRMSPSIISDLNQKIFERVEEWRNRPLDAEYPCVRGWHLAQALLRWRSPECVGACSHRREHGRLA